MYAIDSTKHSPLIGFAYDGFPIYGAYAYKNLNGTGEIVRMKSSYVLRNISVRNQYADGTIVTDGPDVNSTYPLGYFREDYEYIPTTVSTPDFLDEHNGRICITPEYPNGIYCYFATVNSSWNSSYPYVIGPTFYGIRNTSKVTSITEAVTVYSPLNNNITVNEKNSLNISAFPNPTGDIISIQASGLIREDMKVYLYDSLGKLIAQTLLYQGSTIAYFDTMKLYSGEYIVKVTNGHETISKKISIIK